MARLSAREAAEKIGVSSDTMRRAAKKAIKKGDSRIERGRRQFIAEEAVWRELVPGPVSRGRPPKHQSER